MVKGRRYVRICLAVLWVFCSASPMGMPQQTATPTPAANEEADHEASIPTSTA